MSVFEHLTTLASFMLALGIATFLQFIANLLKHRGRIVWSGPLLLFALSVFLSQITYWLGSFSFRLAQHSSLVSVGFSVLYPMLLYVQAELVSAQPAGGEAMDLAGYERRHRRLYVPLMALGFALLAGYVQWLSWLNASLSMRPFQWMLALQCAACLLAWMIAHRRVQWITAALVSLIGLVALIASAQSVIVVD